MSGINRREMFVCAAVYVIALLLPSKLRCFRSGKITAKQAAYLYRKGLLHKVHYDTGMTLFPCLDSGGGLANHGMCYIKVPGGASGTEVVF